MRFRIVAEAFVTISIPRSLCIITPHAELPLKIPYSSNGAGALSQAHCANKTLPHSNHIQGLGQTFLNSSDGA
jgi:hypothetical protein